MKKLIFAGILLLFMFFSITSASAERYDFDGYTVEDEAALPDLSAAAGFLPDEAADNASDLVEGADTETVAEKLKPSFWWDYLREKLKGSLLSDARFITCVLGLIILSAVAQMLLGGDASTGRAACGFTSIFVTLETVRSASSLIGSVSSYVGRLCSMMNALVPVMNALYVTSGRVTQMSVNSSSLMLFITLTQNLNAYVFVPVGSAVLAVTSVLSVTTDSPASALAEFVKKTLIGSISFVTAVFSFVMGIQSSLASGCDTLASKAVRFAAESGIPIVGGAVSEAVTTVGASLSLVKKTTGGAGIVFILLIVLPTTVRMLTFCIALSLLKGAADLIGASSASRVLGSARSVVSVFAALTVCAGILFIFAVTLFMNSGAG